MRPLRRPVDGTASASRKRASPIDYRPAVARIALLGLGMWGHLAPLARLGRCLAGGEHQLHAWVPPMFGDAFASAGATVHPHEPAPVRRPDFNLPEFAGWLAEATEGTLPSLVEALDRECIDLVVHDVHVPWARVAGDFLGLPRIVTTPLFPPEPLEARTAARRAGAAAPLTGDLVGRIGRAGAAIERRWGTELGDWRRVVWNDGETVVNFSTAEITGRAEREPAWTYVGPLLEPPPARPASDGRPRAYVSFGTFFNIPRETLRAAAEAFGGQAVDALLSTGRTAVTAKELEPLPPNVRVREFVAGREALARADLFVTHGGCSSVHEALLAGVPMVCVPHGADQFDWSRRVAELGAGRVARAAPDAIRAAAADVLAGRHYGERAREAGERLRAFDGETKVRLLVARLVG